MKKNIISIMFCIVLLVPSCATSKPTTLNVEETKVEKIVSKDPLMKLLASALIILAINTIVTGGR
tara:strand:- start:803 stop:997 length:195 start_codon:yes stop_codon:yes gene_type:complete